MCFFFDHVFFGHHETYKPCDLHSLTLDTEEGHVVNEKFAVPQNSCGFYLLLAFLLVFFHLSVQAFFVTFQVQTELLANQNFEKNKKSPNHTVLVSMITENRAGH